MAMSKSSLKAKIEKELEGIGWVLTGDYALGKDLAKALANAIVDEIQENAEANPSDGSVK